MKNDEDGMTTISYVLATGLSLLVISWCAMFIVMSYARASIRSASQRASRAGFVAYTSHKNVGAALDACRSTFADDVNEALPLNVRSGISGNCSVNGDVLSVHITGSLRSISILFPSFGVDETTRRPFESVP